MSAKRVSLYDTTLRDGAQGEGISFSAAGKVKLALRLDEFGIDLIEGGFPGSNPKDMAFFRAIREHELKHSRIVAFGSTRRANLAVEDDPVVTGLLDANTEVVTIFGKTWDLHVRDVLRTTLDENEAMVRDTVSFLKQSGKDVIFDAEHFFDGYKENAEYAMTVLKAAADAGASILVLCDTNGGALPHEVYDITSAVVEAVSLPVGIHAHNDGGVGVANTLEAVRAGAVHAQGTVNGFGERCGNADLCTVAANLEMKMGCTCVGEERLATLRELSVYAHDLVNMRPDAKAPFVGQSAFSHKSGTHVNAVQKNPRTFEHIEPEAVGNERHVLISELSGSSSILLKAVEMGLSHDTPKETAREVLDELQEMENRGYSFEAADASFRMLIQKVLKQHKPFFELDGYRVIIERRGKDSPCISEATVKVRVKDTVELTVSEGDGPVNALDGALRKALRRFYPEISTVQLTDFRVRILDPEEATAAKTRVLIESSDGEQSWGTVGVSENIIEASWEALVDSVEFKLFREEERRRAGESDNG